MDRLFLDFQSAIAGRYSLERELGRGGMGVVYLAREVRLDRPGAIKLLPPSQASGPQLRERFLPEARTPPKLSAPNGPSIYAGAEICTRSASWASSHVQERCHSKRKRRPTCSRSR